MRCQRRLLFRKRYGWRRRSFLRDNLTIRNRRRWGGYVTSARSVRSKHTLLRGSHSDPAAQRRRRDLLCAYLDSGFRYRLCAGEGVLRNHHHRTLNTAVCIRHIGDVGSVLNDGCAINGGYLGDVHRRITDIDAIFVSFAHVVGRHINVPRT
jgi:hypothetical protein